MTVASSLFLSVSVNTFQELIRSCEQNKTTETVYEYEHYFVMLNGCYFCGNMDIVFCTHDDDVLYYFFPFFNFHILYESICVYCYLCTLSYIILFYNFYCYTLTFYAFKNVIRL